MGETLAYAAWNDPSWQSWSPAQDIPGHRAFGELQVDMKQIVDEAAGDHAFTLPLPDRFTVPACLAFPRQGAMLIHAGTGEAKQYRRFPCRRRIYWKASLDQAKANPGVGFIGCEPFLNGVAAALAGIERERLANIRLRRGDALALVEFGARRLLLPRLRPLP